MNNIVMVCFHPFFPRSAAKSFVVVTRNTNCLFAKFSETSSLKMNNLDAHKHPLVKMFKLQAWLCRRVPVERYVNVKCHETYQHFCIFESCGS